MEDEGFGAEVPVVDAPADPAAGEALPGLSSDPGLFLAALSNVDVRLVDEAEVDEGLDDPNALFADAPAEAAEPAGLDVEPEDADVGLVSYLRADDADAVADALSAPPVFSATFSAVRSIVTGRFDPDAGEALAAGLSEDPAPLLPDGFAPSGDFLSDAIFSPPDPDRSYNLNHS